MVRGDPSHSGRLLRRVSATFVVLVLLLAGAAFRFDLGEQWFGLSGPSPVTQPALVAPPPGLALPSAAAAPVVAAETSDQQAAPRKVRRALAGLVSDKSLGRHVAVSVAQLADGATVYRKGVDPMTPASTMKLLTSTAVLEALGPDHRFRTTVVAGPAARRIVLVGGGDPFLERAPVPDAYPAAADLRTLAGATARALSRHGATTVRLGYDTSLFAGPRTSPEWEPSYVPDDVVTPIEPLWTNQGRETSGAVTRTGDPAADAARQFAAALARKGIVVLGQPIPARAPNRAEELAAVVSAPLEQIVQRVLEVSDNEGAEVLLRHVAVADGRPGSFKAGAASLVKVLEGLDVDLPRARIFDGSGLSRSDRLMPESLLSVLALGAENEHPELRSVVTGLPVAGFNGSLAYRFQTGDKRGPGSVRAKTGTLTGVHGLAGVVTDLDGTELAFVAMTDKVKLSRTLDARAQVDEIAAALAGCACGAT